MTDQELIETYAALTARRRAWYEELAGVWKACDRLPQLADEMETLAREWGAL